MLSDKIKTVLALELHPVNYFITSKFMYRNLVAVQMDIFK